MHPCFRANLQGSLAISMSFCVMYQARALPLLESLYLFGSSCCSANDFQSVWLILSQCRLLYVSASLSIPFICVMYGSHLVQSKAKHPDLGQLASHSKTGCNGKVPLLQSVCIWPFLAIQWQRAIASKCLHLTHTEPWPFLAIQWQSAIASKYVWQRTPQSHAHL